MKQQLLKAFERFRDSWAFLFVLGMASTMFIAWLYMQRPVLLKALDLKLYDQMMRVSHSTETSGTPVIVDLDERSLAAYGQWPWPRYRVALLLAKIRQAGALAVGIDIVFAEDDRTSPKIIQQDIKRDLQVNMGFTGIPQALMDNDQVLAGVLGQGPFVLGYYLNFDDGHIAASDDCVLHPVSLVEKRSKNAPPSKDFMVDAPSVVCNIPALGAAARMSGFFNTNPDLDGIYRKTPLFAHYKGKLYPSLSMATLMTAIGAKQAVIKVSEQGVESVRVGGTVIPVDRQGQVFAHYRGPRESFPYISASKILSDSLRPGELKGKIVFLGTSAAGLKDLRATPFDPVMPGVEVHATVVDNILQKDFIQRPAWAPGLEFMVLIASGLLTTALLTWARAAMSLIPLGACAWGAWEGAVYLMETKGFHLSPLYSFLALGLNFALLTLVKYWREEGHKKFLQSTFASYLSPELIDEMFENKANPELGGEARVITAFFSDVQSFSNFSEKLTATQLVELLNEYLTAMTDILLLERGTLDKYEGDAIVAFIGAPMDVPDHALRACRIAVNMQNSILALREKWKSEKQLPDEPERNSKGYPPEVWGVGDKWPVIVHNMLVRIGLNSGEIVVGNMGSTMRMNYTMMGDAVNLAARLESGAKQYGVYNLISEYVLDQPAWDDSGNETTVREMVECRFIDNIAVVGKSEPVKVYELVAMKGDLTEQEIELFKLFDQGMKLYLDTQWDAAIEVFKEAEIIERVPEGMTTPSKAYIQRCYQFKTDPPVKQGQAWDGVYRMTKK
ncbi:CHASE2 domain-containing protein [Desulfovibrio ferrophilus]|uniref:Adenylate/guanylate cyclase with Chase sensor n=1 Tax=Desulfovibrio ferrophilus TaxID=241368 RepID=A0A2Z6AWU5_9BACT|nr:adenylate/guanylate cyclase domain-containing protein [Desulfovibrio ferrophilus]BBD07690.1 adenylate/guanylate cyclase with Chase sensor [Desulfovibrio ferrophilus]